LNFKLFRFIGREIFSKFPFFAPDRAGKCAKRELRDFGEIPHHLRSIMAFRRLCVYIVAEAGKTIRT